MNLETRYLWLRTPVTLNSRFGDWRVCWLGGWTRHRMSYLVMLVRVESIRSSSALCVCEQAPTRTTSRNSRAGSATAFTNPRRDQSRCPNEEETRGHRKAAEPRGKHQECQNDDEAEARYCIPHATRGACDDHGHHRRQTVPLPLHHLCRRDREAGAGRAGHADQQEEAGTKRKGAEGTRHAMTKVLL